jgi:hypothetical protein
MILRRLSQSLKTQNWTAIWIEFILLVTGVFLGIQVANWNEERELNKKSAVFTERLRNDLIVEAWRFKALNLYYDDVTSNAQRTLAALEGRAELSNEALLIAAYRATQYAEFSQFKATFDELTSTGNINLIKDLELREIAMSVYSTKVFDNVKNEGINSRYRVAFRMLIPDAVQIAVAQKCGDKDTTINDYESIKNNLDYPCTTGLSQNEIDHAAEALRTDATLAPLLRLRLADIRSATSTSTMDGDDFKYLKEHAKGKP